MSTNKQRDPGKERFWRRVVQQWRVSGLSVRQFCQLRELSEPSFYAWRRTLRQRDTEATPTPFLPVRIVPEPTGAAVAVADADALSIGLELLLDNGRRLCVGPAFDAPTLRRLLTVLEEGRPCS
jgi:transposase-like protein